MFGSFLFKTSVFEGNMNVHYRLSQAYHWWVQYNPHTLSLYVKWNFLWCFPTKMLYLFLISPTCPKCPPPLARPCLFSKLTLSFPFTVNWSAVWLNLFFLHTLFVIICSFSVTMFHQISGLKWKTLRHIAMTNWLSFYNMDNAEFIFSLD